MLLSLFFLSNSFVTVVEDRNKTKSNLNKKTDQQIKLTTRRQVIQKKKQSKIN